MKLPSPVLAAFAGLLARFHRDERGVFAVIFGLLALVLIAMAGAVVDYSRVVQAQTSAQMALDSAALGLQKTIYNTPTPTQATMKTNAQAVVTERLADSTLTVTIDTANINVTNGSLELSGTVRVPTAFVRLVGFPTITTRIKSEAVRGNTQIEVAAALDVTGSMEGSPLESLQDATNDMITTLLGSSNTSTTTRIALVPWSISPNLGSYAPSVRGTIRTSTAITNITWKSGTARTITGITRANPAVVTSNSHGLSNGDVIFITGVNGMTQINDQYYTVASVTTNTFVLSGIDSRSSNGYSSYSSGGTAQRCLTSACELVVTSNAHGMSNGNYVSIRDVNGVSYSCGRRCTMSVNTVWSVASAATNSFALSGSNGWLYSDYTSSGTAWCAIYGCTYNYDNGTLWNITNCVSERTTNAYTEAPPSTTLLGLNYQSNTSDCSNIPQVIPLTNDSTTLTDTVNDFVATGYTAGHLGIAWAWYMLSPNFAYLWPTANRPVAYNTNGVLKIAIFMTDGSFNTQYCNGIDDWYVSCDSANGSSSSQASSICEAMKDADITIYTIGFNVNSTNQTLLTNCSSGSDYDFFPTTTTELESVFAEIANNIQNLRVSK